MITKKQVQNWLEDVESEMAQDDDTQELSCCERADLEARYDVLHGIINGEPSDELVRV